MYKISPRRQPQLKRHDIFRRFVFIFGILILMGTLPATVAKCDENEKNSFREAITEVAEEYIGMPYRYGGVPEKDDMTDNSHLFFAIYGGAAKKAGLEFKKYMTLSNLLKNTSEVNIRNLKNGDLIVIRTRKSVHAGMIINHKGPKSYNVIYASEKRREVVSFDCNDTNFRKYWFDNIKGFFRLNDNMFDPG